MKRTLSYPNLTILLLTYLPSLYFFIKYFHVDGIILFFVFLASIILMVRFYQHKPILFQQFSRIALIAII